jgi:alpha-glucosidase
MRRMNRTTLLAAAVPVVALLAAGLAPLTSAVAQDEQLGAVDGVETDGAATTFSSGDARLRITFLDDNMFRVEMAPDGMFTDPASTPPDDPDAPDAPIVVAEAGAGTQPELVEDDDAYQLITYGVVVTVGKDPILLSAATPQGATLFAETAPLAWATGATIQTLGQGDDEQFLGGGMQNGRFSHRDETIQISTSFNWEDGGWPNAVPWYMSTAGYGVLRNTFAPGSYTFGSPVQTQHNELRFDAYYVVGDLYNALDGYTALTGRPMMPPIYGLELGDADCYNTSNPDSSHPPTPGKLVTPDALNVAEAYDEHDMPRGWMLVNDGYGCEYVDLVETGDGLRDHNIQLGLWTERELADQEFEVAEAGVRVRKLDVAWVGAGYRHALTACEDAHSGIEEYSDARGFVWMVEGWAGSQRCGVQWTGDHSGTLDAIRWQIAIHGSGNSGMAFTAGDVDGIFGGSAESYVRDLQWKALSPVFMTMSGWAGFDKQPWTRGEPYTSINRDYLKLRERLLPYLYTYAAEAHRTGAPVARSMILEYPDDPNTWDDTTLHQFLAGREFLVAPVFQDADVRDGIYLPQGTWVDYWTGRVVSGPTTIDGYEAPLERLPLFVKAGSVVPMWPEGINNHADVAPDARLTLDVYPWGEGSFELYEDDGVTREHQNGARSLQRFTVSAPEGGRGNVEIAIGQRAGDYEGKSAARPYEAVAHTDSRPGAVLAGGQPLPELPSRAAYDDADTGWIYDGATVLAKTADVASDDTLTVRLIGTSSVGGPRPADSAGHVTIDAPAELAPGEPSEITVGFTNAGSVPFRDVRLSVEGPDGWTVESASVGTLAPGQNVERAVTVTPPESGSAGRNTITAVATWSAAAETYDARAGTQVIVPYGSLADAFNEVAITDDDDPAPGNFDNSGNSYSAQALAEEGTTPGATITSRGVDFTWPEAEPGTPNGLKTAGQTIALQGQGTHLAFLGASASLSAVGEYVVRYADGTEDRQSMQLPNWCCQATDVGGSTVAVESFYRNTQDGPANHGTLYAVFHNEIRLLPDKEVVSVVLPDTPAITLFDAGFTERELPPAPSGEVWVSDLEWLSATNGWGPVERDMSNGENAAGDGQIISVDAVQHEKGLGVHAESTVSLYLGASCSRITATIGIDDEIPDYGSVRFSVVGDGIELYRSPVLTGLSAAVELDLDIEEVHYLDLVVDGAGDGVTGDHADWASAHLSC